MSSSLQVALNGLIVNDYVTLAVLTVVGYDYVLTFSKEVKYIWRRPWTWVSTLFIIVRYLGLCYVILVSIGKTLEIVSSCMFMLFLIAVDVVMILRVWAMYYQSKSILYTLLALYAAEIIFTIVAFILSDPQKNISVTTAQVLNLSFCATQAISFGWIEISFYLQVAFGAAICILATIQFVRQSLQMHAETKQWQLNQYMNLLVKEGILYFFAFLASGVINLLFATGKIPIQYWQTSLLYIIEYVPMYTLTPRFMMSIRALYANNVRRGQGSGIDTGFGLVSVSHYVGSRAQIMFADEENEGLEDVEGIPMKVGTGQPVKMDQL